MFVCAAKTLYLESKCQEGCSQNRCLSAMIPYYSLPQIKVAAEKSDHLLCVYFYKATVIYISKLEGKFTSAVQPKRLQHTC